MMIHQHLSSRLRDSILECNKITRDLNANNFQHLAILDTTYQSILNQKPVEEYVCQCGKVFTSRGQKGPHCKVCPKAKQKRKSAKHVQPIQNEEAKDDNSDNEEKAATFIKKQIFSSRISTRSKEKKQNKTDIWKSTILPNFSPKKNYEELFEEDQFQESKPQKKVKIE